MNEFERDPAKLKIWLRERLRGESSKAELKSLLEGSYDHLLTLRLDQLFPPASVNAWIESVLRPDVLADWVRPIARQGLELWVERMRADPKPTGRFVPKEAEAAILSLVGRPGFVHEDWIRAAFKEQAIEGIVRDTLYTALRDFSTIVPRILTNLLPKSRIPMLGTAGVLGAKLIEELERLLEPEIKSFLASGTRKALERAAEYAVQHLEDMATVELRQNLARFVLSKPPAFHALSMSPEARADIEQAAVKIARQVATMEEVRSELRSLIEGLAKKHGARSVRWALEELAFLHRPDFGALTGLVWPLVAASLEGPAVGRWLDGLLDELLTIPISSIKSAAPPPPSIPPGPSWGDALVDEPVDGATLDVPSKGA